MTSLFRLALTTSLSACLVAAAAPDKIDQYVKAEMGRQHIPGLALGVYRDGRIERVQGYGMANVELGVAVKPETLFQSGSVGKQFAATAIMMLVEEGKLRLEDSILKYFPEGPATWAPVTVSHLLSHTSGIGEYETDERTKAGGPFYLRMDLTEDELLRRFEDLPMDFQPGERWRYTNTNFALLGFLIHRVSGKFYGDFLAERIFRPLGMTATRVISEADIIPNRSAGYRLVDDQLKNQEWVSPTYNSTADGTLYFNVLDLARWDAALDTEKLVKRASLDRMWTVFPLGDGKPNPGNYGFAWSLNRANGHRIVEHGGAWQGFSCHFARYLDNKLTVAVLTNLEAGPSNPAKIAHGVACLLDPELVPPAVQAIEDKEPQVTKLLAKVIAAISQGQAEAAWFNGQMWQGIAPKLPALAQQMKELVQRPLNTFNN